MHAQPQAPQRRRIDGRRGGLGTWRPRAVARVAAMRRPPTPRGLATLLHAQPLPCPAPLQVKEVPPAAAAWADDFAAERQQQEGQGPSVWGEEFASFQARQHPGAAAGEQWAQDFAGGRRSRAASRGQGH